MNRRPISEAERQQARAAAAESAYPTKKPEPVANNPALVQRLWSKVHQEPGDGCWLWTGAVTRGQARTSFQGRSMSVARLVMELRLGGPLPEGVMRSACGRLDCVRPDPAHRWLDTARARSWPGGVNVCAKGHTRTLLRADGATVCRLCAAEANKRWKAKKRAG